jgi:hypothetical protein
LVGGVLAFDNPTTQGQEPKWSPHPYQAPTAEAKERTNLDKPRQDEADVGPAPVQRWRKTEMTVRPSRSLRPTTVVAPAIVLTNPSKADTAPSLEPSTRRNPVIAAKWTPEAEEKPEINLPAEPIRLKTPPIDKQRLIHQESEVPRTFEPPTIPNPFPSSSSENPSSSDRNGSEVRRQDNEDLPPELPSIRSSSNNCDTARDLLRGLDIRNIRVDSSPRFAEGYPSRDRANTKTKEGFRETAELRSWYSISGQEMARGKLFDLVFDSVVIEKEDGSKTTILLRKLSDPDQVYVAEKWGIPVTCSLGDREVAERMFADSVLTWKASGLCHKPLYFEDVQLERYGHEWGPVVQPALSTVRFFGDLAVLPYKMGIHPPNECQYALGYYRPGECAPWTRGPVPISLRGALSQAAFVTGSAWALP